MPDIPVGGRVKMYFVGSKQASKFKGFLSDFCHWETTDLKLNKPLHPPKQPNDKFLPALLPNLEKESFNQLPVPN